MKIAIIYIYMCVGGVGGSELLSALINIKIPVFHT